jgi:hypothetical protein
MELHQYLLRREYDRRLTPNKRTKPGPTGPRDALIRAIVELKRPDTDFGCSWIALLLSKMFGNEIDKNTIRRVLVKHYHPESGGGGPSWLAFIAQMKLYHYFMPVSLCIG